MPREMDEDSAIAPTNLSMRKGSPEPPRMTDAEKRAKSAENFMTLSMLAPVGVLAVPQLRACSKSRACVEVARAQGRLKTT